MRISDKGIELIKAFEGCKLTAYRDSVGVWTIGYGHTRGVRRGDVISMSKAIDYLREDLIPVEREINNMGVSLQQGQYDALCSWIFNLGVGNFRSSTMRKYILARKSNDEIAAQMIRWHRAGGKPLLGLKRRRVAEANMWIGANTYYIDASGNIKRK